MSKQILSLTGKVWNVADEADFSRVGSSELVRVLLNNRGVDDIDAFKKISLKNTMPDPFVFVDMKKAVERIVEAIIAGEKIAILGDYDVDGVSSTVIFMNFFDYLKVPYTYSIPNRAEDGYGLNKNNIEKYRDHLVITVDCGSSSFEELQYALNENVDVVVIDHHKMESVPEAVAIVNPHRPDESGQYRDLCAAEVVFMCIVGINRALREMGFYREKKLREPELLDYLDLVALATVCDVMPLVGLNRAFVMNGLKTMRRRKNLGIDALITQGKISDISSDTIAFSFGPKINAAGRLASADLSIRLLFTKNPIEAKKIAAQLDALNRERQRLEQEITNEAVKQIDENANFICVHSKKWHIGVVGIVAGRLKETYRKPCLVIAVDENGRGRGSCRSIAQVDIAAIINKAVQEGILISGGGHSMAAGFCVDEHKIGDFVEFLKKEVKYEKTCKELYADCFLPANMISIDTMNAISAVGPFGNGHPCPKFVIPNLQISKSRVVGRNHIQLLLENSDLNVLLSAIAFRSDGTDLGRILMEQHCCPVQVLGSLSTSTWHEKRSVNFIVEDIASGTAAAR